MLFFKKKSKKEKKKSSRGYPASALIGALSKRKEARTILRRFIAKCRQLGVRPTDVLLSFMINFVASDKQTAQDILLDSLNQLGETIQKLAQLKETLDNIFGNRPASERLLDKLLSFAPLLLGANKTKVEVEEE